MKRLLHGFREGLIWLGLLTPLMLYGFAILRRPERVAIANKPLFQGIDYSRRIVTKPRPLVIHILAIDLTVPGLKPFVTPGFAGANPNVNEPLGQETLAQRTTHFLQEHQLQVAVNANFFYPFREETLWDYAPQPGKAVNLIGTAISQAEVVSPPQGKPPHQRPSLCFLPQQAEIRGDGTCPEETEQAIAGNALLLENSQITATLKSELKGTAANKPYPMNIAAIDATGQQLWLILSDGKQPLYSEGMTLQEAIDLVQGLGAETAVRLDGGGSTTLAMANQNAPARILNAVIHAKVPGQERPVGNHLGFFAQPLKP